jgi:hypothetical protein
MLVSCTCSTLTDPGLVAFVCVPHSDASQLEHEKVFIDLTYIKMIKLGYILYMNIILLLHVQHIYNTFFIS